MTKKIIRGKRYIFEWVDTYNFLGWHHEDEINDKSIDRKSFQETLGFYVKSLKEWHIVAMHYNPNSELGFPEWGNICYIPRSAVKKVTLL